MSTPQRTACLYKGICKLSMLSVADSLLKLLKNISDLQQIGMKFMALQNTRNPYLSFPVPTRRTSAMQAVLETLK